jgi:predicted dienelactone hydrolase
VQLPGPVGRWLAIASLVVLAAAARPACAAVEESTTIGGVDVVVWAPVLPHPGRMGVLLFSHGMYMCPTQSRYLTSALADAGYLVVAPRHSDSSCMPSIRPSLSRLAAKPSGLWDDDDYRDRAEDIRRVIADLPRDARYRGIVDASRLALIGHSLGGYTVLGQGGAWPSWRLGGVRAIVALTPYLLPFASSEGLRNISVPIMYQAGGLDPVFTMPLERTAYRQTPSPKYLVEIAWANHLAWTDLGFSGREAIVRYTIAFLDHYVNGEPETADLHAALPGVSTFLRN